MKNWFILLLGIALLTACNNSEKKQEKANTEENSTIGNGEISFKEEAYDFGDIKEGEIVEHVYKFTNTGSEPVIVSRVTASCGCTTPEYTATPVMPGKDGEIKVRFNSNGQIGRHQKIITVVSNAVNNIQTIQLIGNVS